MSESQKERRYWRSVERLLDSPAVQEELQKLDGHEFPEGASLPPDAMSRRTMLTIMGASFSLAGLASCRRPVEKILPFVNAPEHVIPGVPKHYASIFPLATAAYGIVVESHDGRPTKVEGNELHPASHGAASTWMQASILDLYDPDRSSQVLHLGEESGELEPATWDDFDAFGQTLTEGWAADGGAGLAVVLGEHASPTLNRLSKAFKERYPQARWVVHEPVSDRHQLEGVRLATGTAMRPVYDLSKASIILSLDADFLYSESDALNHAHGFAAARRVKSNQDAMSRLYVAESTLSVTGSNADHRLSLKSSQIASLAKLIASELGLSGLATDGADLPEAVRQRAGAIAAELTSASGSAVVLVGRRQPAVVHALGMAINQALGALGSIVELHPVDDIAYSDPDGLNELAEAMRGGSVSTVLVLGGNPVYNTPGSIDFAAAYASVENRIHLGHSVDETSAASTWHLPLSTFFEAWGDARAVDSTLSVVQPLIAPLFASRSVIEVVQWLTTGEKRSGYDLVRETWQSALSGDFEKAWRRALHDGLAADAATALESSDSASSTIDSIAIDSTAIGAAMAALPTAIGELEINFQPSLTTYDGRYANNGWLQELPDPITKVVWDNVALISPRTAEQKGLARGDLVTIRVGEATVEAPIFVLPGQADDAITLTLGYGRSVGRVAGEIGYSAYVLQDAAQRDYIAGSLDATGKHYELVQTQDHWQMKGEQESEDRPIVREGRLEDYAAAGSDMLSNRYGPENSHQLFGDHDYSTGYQWAMSIDLNTCIGCNACVIACQSENNIPIVGKDQVRRGREMHWIRVDRYFVGDDLNDPDVAFQPVPCMHCENAPCEQVCPVAATVHDSEGINAMVYNRCIGTRYCSNNCPYKVRRFNFYNFTKDTPELLKMAMNPDVTVRSRGVMEKCTYCVQRISQAKIDAKKDGRTVRDGDIRTACQQTCPTDAITFGNLNEADSQVNQRKAQDLDYELIPDLNNRPRTSYLAKLRNPNQEWEKA